MTRNFGCAPSWVLHGFANDPRILGGAPSEVLGAPPNPLQDISQMDFGLILDRVWKDVVVFFVPFSNFLSNTWAAMATGSPTYSRTKGPRHTGLRELMN